ncbi:hypothetical protein M3Y98_00051500 [Aphelenchoides besseyi]|nr:hypothetical protein M3Y98_00051500 [Aphelenchoides besseyi]KAI6198933.1 hypothetical protein M3Y96_00573100 [Aphelenchoides besseyi]
MSEPVGFLSRDVVKWFCGIGAAAFVGYAIYFDYCRTHAPDYKEKIREKRKKQEVAREQKSLADLPDITNQAEVQQYFLQQIQLGEELLGQGIVDEGIKHLCNAIILCGQPEQLLSVFQQTMPNEYPRILEELPRAQIRIGNELKSKFGGAVSMQFNPEGSNPAIVDTDDLE